MDDENGGVWHLVTFGGGDPRYCAMSQRLARQARQFGGVRAHAVTERNLHAFIGRGHAARIRSFAAENPRGYGYWTWKPLLVASFLADPRVAGVIYVDAGCELNPSPRALARLGEWIAEAEVTGHRIWSVEGDWTDRMYTKADVARRLNCTDEHLDTRQIQSGVFLLANRPECRELADAWTQLSMQDGGRLIDDSPSSEPEDRLFREHRHDQSLFSLLAKARGWDVQPNETFFGERPWEAGRDFPVWAVRNRRFTSIRAPRWVRFVENLAVGILKGLRGRSPWCG